MDMPDDAARARRARQVKTLLVELGKARPPNERGKRQFEPAPVDPRTPDERLADLAREYGAKPVRMSAEALAKYGVQPAADRWPGLEGEDERELREAM